MDPIEAQAKKLEELGWIPAENAPENLNDVWVTGYSVFKGDLYFKYLSIGYYDGEEWTQYDSGGEFSFVVTHYFPLNKPNLP